MTITVDKLIGWLCHFRVAHGGDTPVRVSPTTDAVDHMLRHDIAGLRIQVGEENTVNIVLTPYLKPVEA